MNGKNGKEEEIKKNKKDHRGFNCRRNIVRSNWEWELNDFIFLENFNSQELT